MPTINEAKRITKRIMLTNLLTNDYNLAVTPLLSGKHGIGKSQVAKQIAKEIGGICITIEGGTLKEGEITGIPYQYKNEQGEIQFKFLPYYVVDRIQKAERMLNEKRIVENTVEGCLLGDENKYFQDNLSFEEKIKLIENKQVTPVILFFDEINRTENAVYRELMNIILTRTVNGYKFPWWVFIVAAMNPSSQNSIYSTNEMDPAQMDRFIKIKVREDASEWVNFALENDFDETIINFIANNQKCLASDGEELSDEDIATPSPRGWNMIDLILKGKEKLDNFFNKSELEFLDKDIKLIINSKVGVNAGNMYYASLKDNTKVVSAKEIFNFKNASMDEKLIETIRAQSTVRNSITSKDICNYLKMNFNNYKNDEDILNIVKERLATYLKLIDNSSKLVFAQSLITLTTKDGYEIYDDIYEIFDDKIINLLEDSNLNVYKIKGK